MIRALVIKELRECLPLLLAALLPAIWALSALTGGESLPWAAPGYAPPNPVDALRGFQSGTLPAIMAGFALLLGIKQAVWEDVRGTYHYLLHRPVERSHVLLIKAAVGIALVQLLGAAMILYYGAWASTPGTHPSPFFWSMTTDAWQVWAAIPVVYLGALLCGLRPARWYGSRLLPLVGCGFLAIVVGLQSWLWITTLGVAIASALIMPCILYVAQTRDF